MHARHTLLRLCALLGPLFSLGCDGGEPMASYPTPGVATVEFRPQPTSVPNLFLTAATMRLGFVQVIGNVPPPRQPPPDQQPPPGGWPPPPHLTLDAIAGTQPVTFSMLPQGLYSRVQFDFDSVSLRGSWRGIPFRASLATFNHRTVDLRTSMPQELGPDQDATFRISVAPSLWFGGYLLDGAAVVDGEIVCDDMHNPGVAATMTDFIGASFSMP